MATLSFQAEPYALEFEPGSTALLMIDMQRDFLESGGVPVHILEEVNDNLLGLYDDLAENRRWAEYYRKTLADRKEFLELMYEELPTLMDGTAGL